MKQLIIFTLLLGLSSNLLLHSQAVTVTNTATDKRVWIGMNDTQHALLFGKGDGADTNNGLWCIDHDFNGLNFCKPWPTSSSGNCLLHLNNHWGLVGIWTSNPQSHFHVAGDIAHDGSVWQYSDINLKQNILPLKSNLSDLLSLSTITYNRKHIIQTEEELLNGMKKEDLDEVKYKTLLATIERQKEEAARDKKIHYGLIAQELEKTFPDLVDKDRRGYLRVDYTGMIPVLINAIKELDAKNDELNSKIAALESHNLLRNNADIITTNAMLYQNNPNPFSERTEIKYYIPTIALNATLCVYDLNGSQILKMDISGRENGSISINANQLKAGMYLYTLLVDGKEVDTKKMILTGE